MKRISTIVIVLIAALAGVAILIACFGKKPSVANMERLKEPVRSSSIDNETHRRVGAEICKLTNLLAAASSQREYDELLPLLLERNTMLGGLHWTEFVKPELAKGPILKMLSRGSDDFAFAAAAWVAGTLDFQEATPLLIDYMTLRYAGRSVPDNNSTDVICACRALARFAHRGNKQAAEFLIGRSKLNAWDDIAFKISIGAKSVSRTETADYMWTRACDALLYYPHEDSIKALQASGYRYASHWIYLIRQFMASGDAYEEYWKDVNAKGELSNKYMTNAPSWVMSTEPVGHAVAPTNAHSGDRRGSVTSTRLPVSTNSDRSVE